MEFLLRLRFALVFSIVYLLAFITMLPVLVGSGMPVKLWPVAVLYALFMRGSSRGGGNVVEVRMIGDQSDSTRKRDAAAWELLKRIPPDVIRAVPMNLAVDIDNLLNGRADTDAVLERTAQNSLEDRAILDLLKSSIRPHLSVDEDCYYSCPKAEDYCGGKPRDKCTCGADVWNERVTAVLAAWGQDSQRAG